MTLQVQAFPSCCGMFLLHGFDDGSVSADNLQQSLSLTRKTRAVINEEGQTVIVEGYNNSILIVHGKQKKRYQKLLEEKGFREIYSFFNPNTSAVLHLFIRDYDPEISPSNPAFNKKKYEIVPSQVNKDYLIVKRKAKKK